MLGAWRHSGGVSVTTSTTPRIYETRGVTVVTSAQLRQRLQALQRVFAPDGADDGGTGSLLLSEAMIVSIDVAVESATVFNRRSH